METPTISIFFVDMVLESAPPRKKKGMLMSDGRVSRDCIVVMLTSGKLFWNTRRVGESIVVHCTRKESSVIAMTNFLFSILLMKISF